MTTYFVKLTDNFEIEKESHSEYYTEDESDYNTVF